MVLVSDGTVTVGSQVVAELSKRGARSKVLTSDPAGAVRVLAMAAV